VRLQFQFIVQPVFAQILTRWPGQGDRLLSTLVLDDNVSYLYLSIRAFAGLYPDGGLHGRFIPAAWAIRRL